MSEYKKIDGKWYRLVEPSDLSSCPQCLGTNFIKKPADEKFRERVGCLDCDIWFGPSELKEQGDE